MLKFVNLPRQDDFWMYPHAFAVPGQRFESDCDSPEVTLFWQGVEWCEDHFGRENKGHMYFTGTWTVGGPQKPRLFMANAQDGFAFKLRWC